MKPGAVLLDNASLAPNDLDMSGLWQLPLNWQVFDTTSADQTDARLCGNAVVLTNKVVLGAEHFRRHPEIRLVVILATGTNNVDLAAARQAGVRVCNMVDYSTPSVVQHTLMVMLVHFTRLLDYTEAVAAGRWQQSAYFGLMDYRVEEIRGKTLGIIGFGRIGQAVAAMAALMGMTVLVAESLAGTSHPDRVPLAQLLAQADIVSVHCPLTQESRNLLDASALAMMKPEALLINVGRGGIVDEFALAEALRYRRLGGAAIDVLSQEPPASDNPLLAPDLPNLILTPHTAWASVESRQRLVGQAVSILRSFLAGQDLPNAVV